MMSWMKLERYLDEVHLELASVLATGVLHRGAFERNLQAYVTTAESRVVFEEVAGVALPATGGHTVPT